MRSSTVDLGSVAELVHQRVIDDTDCAGRVEFDRVAVARILRASFPLLSPSDAGSVIDCVVARAVGLGALEPLLADPSVSEVMVNGPGPVWVERGGCIERTEVVVTVGEVEHLVEKIIGPLGLRVDRLSPLVDARLPDGSRVNAIVPPLAVDGPCLTIRRFGVQVIELADMCPADVAAMLRQAVVNRMNILVAGGTGAGKTTVLNALAREISPSERLVTVEDVAELALDHEHVVRLETRPSSADGVGQVDIRDLVRNALRMRPDRIIVGEVRGPEALDMLQAMNTGHEGSLSTCHANTPVDALRRLETMVLQGAVQLPLAAIRDQIRSSIDLVVEIARRSDGSRAISAVAEVVDDPQSEHLRVREVAGNRGVLSPPSRTARRLAP
jgi:pilus assembly protein CpaF